MFEVLFLPFSPASELPATINPATAVEAFRRLRPCLQNLTRHCLPTLANSLLAEYIIPRNVSDNACNPAINMDQRCVGLLQCVEDRLEVMSSDFTKVINILHSEPFLECVATELVHSYSEWRDSE